MAGVPYTFANATTSIPLSQLDANFNTTATLGNAAIGLGNVTTTVGNLTLTNVNITSGTINAAVTQSGFTGNSVIYSNTSGNLTTSANMTFDGSTLTTLNSAYTGTLTGGTGIVNLGSGQFYKDASGNVGIGTSSPSSKLVVKAATDQGIWVTDGTYTGTFNPTSLGGVAVGTNGAYPLIFATNTTERMRIDSSGNVLINTTTQTDKVTIAAGNIGFVGTTSTINFRNGGGTIIQQIQYSDSDGSLNIGGTGGGPYPLKFSTNSTERMRIDSSGNLLVGTTGVSTAPTTGFAFNPQTVGAYAAIGHTTSAGSGAYYISFGYNGGVIGTITQAGTTGVLYNVTSDYRLKDVVSTISDSGSRIDALQPINYTMKADGSAQRGFLAHQFQAIYPNSVSGEKDAVDAEGKPVYQAMQASSPEVMADLISEIQSLRKRVAQLEK